MDRRVDFHSHILPGVDDGSRSVEESLEMLRAVARQGIGTVVATPPFYANHDTPERFLRRRLCNTNYTPGPSRLSRKNIV